MRVRMFSSAALAAFVSLGVSAAAQAATIIYTDEKAFEADVADVQATGFDALTPLQWQVAGATATVSDGEIGDVVRSGSDTVLTLNSAMTSFGGNFQLSRGGWGHGLRFTLIRDNGSEEALSTILARRNGFFGFTSTEAFSAVRISWSGSKYNATEAYALNDVRVAPVASVEQGLPVSGAPEPSTWAVMLAGFAVVGGSLRRRTSKTAVA